MLRNMLIVLLLVLEAAVTRVAEMRVLGFLLVFLLFPIIVRASITLSPTFMPVATEVLT